MAASAERSGMTRAVILGNESLGLLVVEQDPLESMSLESTPAVNAFANVRWYRLGIPELDDNSGQLLPGMPTLSRPLFLNQASHIPRSLVVVLRDGGRCRALWRMVTYVWQENVSWNLRIRQTALLLTPGYSPILRVGGRHAGRRSKQQAL
jgi:hypothetical protein